MVDGVHEFSVSYDKTTKIITAAVVVLLGGVAFGTESVGVGCLGAAVLLISYAFSPRGYSVAEDSIIVRRLAGSVRLPLWDIREVRRANREDFRGSIRVFGNGGLFGYYGIFRTTNLGTCHWYITDRSNAVVVLLGNKAIVLSPDDVDGFVETVKAAAGLNGSRTGMPAPEGYNRGSSRYWTLIGIGLGVVALLLGIAALLYSPGPPRYTLTREGLAIHDRFYPVTVRAAEIDVDRVRVVDIAVDPHWRPTMRTNGFANGHYRAGWFRVSGGEKVRMYRADGKRLVLLPPIGATAPVLLEVREPERFIEELKQAWR